MKCFSPKQARLLLRECARRSFLRSGMELHAVLTTTGLPKAPKSYLSNALCQFYAACGDTASAHKLFDEIPVWDKDTVDWTNLLSSFTRSNFPVKAMRLFVEMRRKRVEIDDVAVVCAFGVCAKLEDLVFGVQEHGFVAKMGFLSNVKVCNALMDMYGKCGLVAEAKRVFEETQEKSVVSWTVVLDTVVKLEGLARGREVFDEMPERNAIAWTVIVAAYVGAGFTDKAFELLAEMVFCQGYELNFVTLCSVLSACAQSGDLVIGRWIHVNVLKKAITMGEEETTELVIVETALVDMYAKCGSIDTAMKVFRCMPKRNVVSWNAMFSGLAMHGRGKTIIHMFPEMVREVKPDDLTFTAILSACSHSGMVEEGWQCFNSLRLYGLEPKVDHYACMVDLLGRAGHVEEAEVLMRQMPVPPNEVVLGSLLGSSSLHGKLKLAERVKTELMKKNPGYTEYHALMSNIYAIEGRKDIADGLRGNLKNWGIRKIPGMSSIRFGGFVHRFSSGDKSHPRTGDIYRKLDEVIGWLRSAGYVPDASAQAFSGDGDMEEKEQALFYHSEKLAVCFGLLETRSGTPLYIFKNLRICRDCHSAMKFVSKIYNREIIVRDRNRFHHIKGGSCSCSDYW